MSSNPLIRVNKEYYREAKKLMNTGYFSNLEEAYQEVLMNKKVDEVTKLLIPAISSLSREMRKQEKDSSKRGGFLYG